MAFGLGQQGAQAFAVAAFEGLRHVGNDIVLLAVSIGRCRQGGGEG